MISREKFMTSMSTGEKIIKFLSKHKNYAFTREEIAKELKISKEVVSARLKYIIKKKKKVLHRKPYWIIKKG